jgi:hypothetical protein
VEREAAHRPPADRLERADEVLWALRTAEALAAELAQHAAQDHRALEVFAGLAGHDARGGSGRP